MTGAERWALLTPAQLTAARAAGIAARREVGPGAVRRAVRQGRWAVVVHPLSQQQLDVAMQELRARSDRVVRSL